MALDKIEGLFSSAAEIQTVSNNAHLIWGISLLIVALLLLVYSFGYKKKILPVIISVFLLLTVKIFILYLLLNQGVNNFWNVFYTLFAFPEFYIHIIMSLVATTGIVVELLVSLKRIKHPLAPLALPLLSTIGVGILFIIHPRSAIHDGNTMFIHSLMGSAFILAGIMLILQRFIRDSRYERLFGVLASIFLFISAILLIQFKESPIAYQSYFPAKVIQPAQVDAGDKVTIYITAKWVVPQNIKIKRGGEVTFYQIDSSLHDLNSGPHPVHTEYPPLNIGYLKQNVSKTVIFKNLGTYGFHDHLHEDDKNLQGQIEVY